VPQLLLAVTQSVDAVENVPKVVLMALLPCPLLMVAAGAAQLNVIPG
jgi:hypothetical protein